MIPILRTITIVIFFFLFPFFSFAQNKLTTKISIDIRSQNLNTVLIEIGRTSNFVFSYNSDILPKDSSVSIHFRNTSIRTILDEILGTNYEYIENGKYIVILKKETKREQKLQYITGYIIDPKTNTYIENASIYDIDQLTSELSNKEGFFKIKIRDNSSRFRCIVSKDFYVDKVIMNSDWIHNAPIKIYLKPQEIGHLEPVAIANNKVEKTWLGRTMLPYKQMVQSLNIKNFFVNKPFQLSFIPSLGTHGNMGGQVKNKISINILGGYSGATHGVELGGLFNIVKQDVNGIQVAGIFNVVGSYIKGVQIAGIYNEGLSTFSGVQISGIFNRQMGSVHGLQLAGIYNVSEDSTVGIQLAGLFNSTKKNMHGVQFSGFGNKVYDSLHGWQISPIYNIVNRDLKGAQLFSFYNNVQGFMKGFQFGIGLNRAKILHGIQLGLINSADSSDGYSFGLVNFGKNYMQSFSVYTNELMPYNFAYKSGNPKLYNILLFGISPNTSNRQYTFGYGLGKTYKIASKLTLEPELTAQGIYFKNMQKSTFLIRLQPSLNWKFSKHFKLFAGPSYTWWNKINDSESTDNISTNGIFPIRIDNKNSWFAGQIGLSLF